MIYTATYSPEDNKLRLYASARLPKEVYERVRSAGFIFAPKQALFVAPMWTPEREDVLLDIAGEIGDEDTSLVERAEERAERFEQYSENRAEDAQLAKEAVSAIADNIPLGQPILVGHHSERRARKDAERIENGMRKAIKMWDQSKYWQDRASGALRHAKYKERPDVRARRIKKLEADQRKQQRNLKEAEGCLKFWRGDMKRKDGSPLEVSRESALFFCNYYDHSSFEFPISKYPRQLPASQYEGHMGLWSALGGSDDETHMVCTLEQARDLAIQRHSKCANHYRRWIAHYENRLAYERAMLEEKTYTPEPKREWKPEPKTEFDDMREALRGGVKIVSAPQLFPTPPDLAKRMVDLADIQPGNCVLEPSAGTGRILEAINGQADMIHLDAIEINPGLVAQLKARGYENADCRDFLEVQKPYCPDAPEGWDRIIMNPPFDNGSDIKHIQHALTLLRPNGRLVAICANGPRQQEALKPLASEWFDLPEGTFKNEGTNVNTALIVIDNQH